jgi:hypothetical protein
LPLSALPEPLATISDKEGASSGGFAANTVIPPLISNTVIKSIKMLKNFFFIRYTASLLRIFDMSVSASCCLITY